MADELSDLYEDFCRLRNGATSKLAKDVRIMLIHDGTDVAVLAMSVERIREEVAVLLQSLCHNLQ
jgi:hypothetical protein